MKGRHSASFAPAIRRVLRPPILSRPVGRLYSAADWRRHARRAKVRRQEPPPLPPGDCQAETVPPKGGTIHRAGLSQHRSRRRIRRRHARGSCRPGNRTNLCMPRRPDAARHVQAQAAAPHAAPPGQLAGRSMTAGRLAGRNRAANRRHHTPCLQLQARAGPPDRATLKRAASGICAGQARHRLRASREARSSRPRPKPSAKRRTASAGRHVTIRGIRREYMAAGKQGGRPGAFARGRSRPRRRTMRIR